MGKLLDSGYSHGTCMLIVKFLGIQALKSEISSGTLGQRDVFSYWLASTVILALCGFPVAMASEPTVWAYFCWVASLIINITMLRKCYLANGGASGAKFSDKFISIGWVVTVRGFLLIFLPLLLVGPLAIGIAGSIAGASEVDIINLAENAVLLEALIYLLWVWLRTAAHIRDVR